MIKELLSQKKGYIDYFFDRLDFKEMEVLCEKLIQCKGKVCLTGIGKSSIIANKIAMTMISTGTPALYISALDALHGDLGSVKSEDIIMMFSKSGESDELIHLLPCLRNKGAYLVAIVSNDNSRLAKACDYSVTLPLERELCPFDLAPTTSAVIQLIFGDILTVAMMKQKQFSLDQYALNHPAGRIGKRITFKVKDLMIDKEDIPLCFPEDRLLDVLVTLSNKKCGCLLVVNEKKQLQGIFTDGDLRRALQNHVNQLEGLKISDVMTESPISIAPNAMAWDALKLMEANPKKPITVLSVLEEEQVVVGLIKMHDILQSGIS